MATNKLVVTLPSDTEILQTRTFDAPRDLVWKAISDPALIPLWWGPRKYTTVVDRMDFHTGGKWRFVQTDPNGNIFAFRGEYREVVAPERVVDTFEFEPLAGHISVERMTLTEKNGQTILATLSKVDSKEDRDGMLQSGMESGASETMDRLEELLAQKQHA